MTRESVLEVALTAISNAGGPVKAWPNDSLSLRLPGDTEALWHFGDGGPGGSTDAAIIIHVLKADVRARGCTIDSYEYKHGSIEVTITSTKKFRNKSYSVTETHKDERVATALAWLAAFA